MHANLIASEYALNNINQYHTSLNIFIDCLSAIKSITSSNVPTNHHTLIRSIKLKLKQIQECFSTPINLYWIPSHCNIKHSDLADKNAKLFAKPRPTSAKSTSITIAKAKLANIESTNFLWNKRWSISPEADFYKILVPDITEVPEFPKFPDLNGDLQKSIIRLRINHTNLPAHKSIISSNTYPLCDICGIRFNIDHLFFECVKYDLYR